MKPLLAEFWKCVSEIKVLPKSRLGKAIAYANGQQEYLNHVLDYGEVDLSNNTCEQAVKTLVIDRKNFLFSTNPKGAEANAIWLTLIKSATENGIDILAYL
ncbi:transposase [Lactobacillus sp. ESL0791]|nr:transposase [Lactobacillus sp. ESL0791]MDF7638487.1 transposase [Lactobacillus sp. ESL0791]